MSAVQTRPIYNSEDVIDSRTVIERIEFLESMGGEPDLGQDTPRLDVLDEDEREELTALKALQEEAEGYAADWRYGETLIRDTYFKDYAMQLADAIGAIDAEAHWPLSCIDWDQAARELRMDYTAVEFAGVTYWVR